jgi:hypothetical protein
VIPQPGYWGAAPVALQARSASLPCDLGPGQGRVCRFALNLGR